MIDEPPVRFQLRFAGTPDADAAAKLLEVGPHPRQPRQHVLELRQLDLHLGFGGSSANREDVEDQLGAIHHPRAGRILDVLALARAQLVVENDQRRLSGARQFTKLVDLALAEVGPGVRAVDLLHEPADDLRSRGIGKLGQLLEMLVGGAPRAGPLPGCSDENGPFDGRSDADQIFADVLLDNASVRACCICPSAKMEWCNCRPAIRR